MGGRDITQLSAADMVRDIEERHRMLRRTMDRHVIEAEESAVEKGHPLDVAVSQQSLVPSVSDPSLWMFNCAPGKEQELVIQIMNKCKANASQGKPLGITSAVAAQTKGKIYVESYSEPNVIIAVQGIRNLMQYSMRLVPISDMTTVMTVLPKKRPGMIHPFCFLFPSSPQFFSY
jgi:transcription elongation factor SPT5